VIGGTLHVLPWFVPGVALSIVIALLACRPVGRWLGVGTALAGAILVGLGVIVAATLTPLRGAFDFDAVRGTCDLARIGPAPIREVLRVGDTSLNIALFIPLGCAIGLVAAAKSRPALMVAAVALPFAIEAIQLIAPILDRGCQSADIFDNLTGLAIGLTLGTTVRVLDARRR
jgi:hypothetical protein